MEFDRDKKSKTRNKPVAAALSKNIKASNPIRIEDNRPDTIIQAKSFANIPTTKNTVSEGVIQRVDPLDYLSGNMNEDEKDSLYFRRSGYNPMNYFAQQQNENYENNSTAYHSTSVHGAQNSLFNVRDRHYLEPGGPPGMSHMQNTMTGLRGVIRRQARSSRFTSSSWEKHGRNDAISSFENAAAGFTVHWNPAPPPFGAPMAGRETSRFFISYTNPLLGDYEVGVNSRRIGGPNATGPVLPSTPTNVIQATINYQLVGANAISAWIGQLYPVPAVGGANNTGPVVVANHVGTAWSFSDFNPFG